jgi:hypothetical protein
MEHFYDGQIRRYLTQFMRLMSNFSYKDARGNLVQVPVRYGDATRQVSSVMKKNSENIINSAPFIACYIKSLDLARDRLQDPTFVSKLNIRERQYTYVDENPDSPTYGQTIQDYANTQGENYTVERLMPTPYNLQFSADIWSTNTEQKLQILEQILVLFRPAFEIQTTNNYIDWTSLSYVELNSVGWTSRQIPQGTENDLDIANLSFNCPIWISTPAKVKKLGIITKIIANIFTEPAGTIGTGELVFGNPNAQVIVSPGNFSVLLDNSTARLVKHGENLSNDTLIDIPVKNGVRINWNTLLDLYPGKFRTGLSYIVLEKPDGSNIVGYMSLSSNDEDEMELLQVSFDGETLLNTDISDLTDSYTRGTVNAVINPTTFNPGKAVDVDTRYLILEDINTDTSIAEADMPLNWKLYGQNSVQTDRLVAHANDIIQWDGTQWNVILDSSTNLDITYITNSYTGIQYKWDGEEWTKAVDGLYTPGQWRLVL